MSCGETFFIGKSQRNLVGQAEMQRLIGIEECSRGRPQARQKTEQRDGDRRQMGVALEPFILFLS